MIITVTLFRTNEKRQIEIARHHTLEPIVMRGHVVGCIIHYVNGNRIEVKETAEEIKRQLQEG